MLPFGMAMVIAVLGALPLLLIVVRASKKSPTVAQTIFACAAALVGAWDFLNAATPILNA